MDATLSTRGEEKKSVQCFGLKIQCEEASSPDILRVSKYRNAKWAEHVALMGEMIKANRIFVGKLKGRDHSKDLAVDGKLILECTLRK
jgi:hypothetical protein